MKKRLLTLLGGALLGLFSMNASAEATWTDITKDNVAASEDNMLQNSDFATLGTVKDGAKYNVGEPWTWNIGSGNIRVEASSKAQSGGNVLIWRGSGNNWYVSQSITGVKPNTWYEIKMSQVANGNASANFNVGIGTGAGKYDVASNTVKLGSSQDGVKTIHIFTPSSVSAETTYHFTFANTSTNTASSGSDPVTQIDWMSMVECFEDHVEGTGYLYNEATGTFLSRGNEWGTRSITDKYGYPLNINVTGTFGASTYSIKFLDAQTKGLGKDLFTDNGTPQAWTFAGDADNGFTVYNSNAGGYLTVDGNHKNTKVVANAEDASKWKVISAAEHKTIIASQLGANKLAVSEAAGIDVTTEEDFDGYISTNFVAKDYTSKVQSASLTGSNTGWTWTRESSRNKGNLTTNENGSEIYQGVGTLTQTVSDLDEGIYKVTIQGFYRDGSNANCVTYDNAGWQMSNMYFKGNDYETRVMGWAENRASDTNPNSMAEYKTLAGDGKYMNTFYTYVGSDGSLALTLGLPSYPAADNGFWAIFSNVTLTYYSDEVSDADATAILATVPEGNMASGVQSALESAVDDFETDKTIANYNALSSAIEAANASIADYAALQAAIDAVSYTVITPADNENYVDLAAAMVAAQDIHDAAEVESCADAIAALDAAVKAAKVADYTYVTTNFQYGVELGTWKTTGDVEDFHNEHWSGINDEDHSYKNQDDSNGRGYNSDNGFTIGLNQDVKLPAGKYIFKACGRKSAGATMTLTVKNGENVLGSVSDFPSGNANRGINKSGATSFDEDNDAYANNGKGFGWEWRFVSFELTEEATVNVAVSASATTKSQWASFGNYSVLTNNETNTVMIAYSVALNDAKAAIDNDTYKNVTGTERTALNNAINATPEKTKDAIEAATAALTEATVAFTAAAPAYDAYVAYKAKIEALDDDGKAKFDELESDLEGLDENTISVAVIESVPASYTEALKAQTTPGTDLTSIIENAAVTSKDGWSGSNTNSGEQYTDAPDNTYFDVYNATGDMKQNIGKLQPGNYSLKCATRASTGMAGKVGNVYVSQNSKNLASTDIHTDGNTNGELGNGWSWTEVIFEVKDAANDITIGFYAQCGGGQWAGADNFFLTYLGDASANMTITDAKWGTFVAPFAVAIPEGVEAYTCDAVEGDAITTTEVKTTIPANTPVLVYSETAVSETFYGKAVSGTPEEGIMVGTYEDVQPAVGCYLLQKNDDNTVTFNQIVSGGATPWVRANRCYLSVSSSSTVLRFGDATGIQSVEQQSDAVIYDLTGRRVDAAVKGIYIVNGKKMLVK